MTKWLNRNEFEAEIRLKSMSVGITDKDIFSLAGIDTQLESFQDVGIIFLRTRPWVSSDVEEFAACKIGNNVWKFSMDLDIIEDIKYGKIAK